MLYIFVISLVVFIFASFMLRRSKKREAKKQSIASLALRRSLGLDNKSPKKRSKLP
jgi:uncharacterized membrane protein